MPTHRCIGPETNHDDITKHSDASVLDMYRTHIRPGWYDEILKQQPHIIPASLRRWMRMTKNEVHRRGLTP